MSGFKKTEHGNVLFGKEFPEHLQIAYGRNIARLEYGLCDKVKVWLRDLPLSVYDLSYMGFTEAEKAREKELSHIRERLLK